MSSSDHKTLGIRLDQLGPDLVATALSRGRLTHVWLVKGTGKATSPKLKFSSDMISEGTRMGYNTIFPPHICEGSLMKDGEGTTESTLAGVLGIPPALSAVHRILTAVPSLLVICMMSSMRTRGSGNIPEKHGQKGFWHYRGYRQSVRSLGMTSLKWICRMGIAVLPAAQSQAGSKSRVCR